MNKVLITGGAGFIGSQFGYKLYQAGYDVVLLDDMSFGHEDNLLINGNRFGTFIHDSVCSKKMFEYTKNIDYLYHFAGIAPLPVCQENPSHAINVNVAGTANILEAARINGIKRVIFASTSAVYENNKNIPFKESDKVHPDLIYATSKYQAELLCHSFKSVYGVDVVIVRFFNVYGPHQDFLRKSPPLIGYLIKELMAHKSPILHSTGKQRRDYVYIDDVSDLLMLCMTHPSASGEVFNVASGETVSVEDIFNYVKATMGIEDIEAHYRPAKHFWDQYPLLFTGSHPLSTTRLEEEVNKLSLGSIDKAYDMLGWRAKVSMLTGIKNTVRYALSVQDR